MRHTIHLLPLLLLAACTEQSTSPTALTAAPQARVSQGKGPVIHRVSVGGPDICTGLGEQPGCNANLSLIAMQHEDGSVSGQLSDQYGGGNDGVHADVDCLVVQVIPGRTTLEAWVGGALTHPKEDAGRRIILRVRDNGTSMNDPLDALSAALIDPVDYSSNCQDMPGIGFQRSPEGQVTIW